MARLKQDIPEIRFEGFSGEWDKFKLDKVFSIFSGNAFSSKDQSKQGIKWLKISDVGIQQMTPNNPSYLPEGFDILHEKYLINKNDVVVALTRPILSGRLKIAIAGEHYHGALLNQRVGKLVSSENNILFIYSLLQKSDLINKFESSIAGTDPPNLSLNEIKDIPLIIPSIQEQTQIGAFFQQLDKLIALQTRAVEVAERYKKAMLQKLFPQKGEKVPRIRFAGFSGDLFIKKANKVFKTISEKNHEYLPVLSATQDKGIVYRDEVGIDIQYDKESLKNYKKICKDQFVIHLRSFQGGLAYSEIEGISSPAYTIIDFIEKSDFDALYWKYLFISGNFIKRLESITYGVRDGRSISFSDFSTLSFNYPSLEEQTAIGSFFQKLDEKIGSEKKKLEQYQLMKRAMLQRMFV